MTQKQIKAVNDALSTATLVQYLVGTCANCKNMVVSKNSAIKQMQEAGIDKEIIDHFDTIISQTINRYSL